MGNELINYGAPEPGERRAEVTGSRVAYTLTAVAMAVVAASCAAGKNIHDMTLEEYVAAYPGCVQKQGTLQADGSMGYANDLTSCEDAFVRAQALAAGGVPPGDPLPEWKSPDNVSTEESDVGRPGYPKLYNSTDGDSDWVKYNMVRQKGESREAFAKRVEGITASFLSDTIANLNLAIEDCGADTGCLDALLKHARDVYGMARFYADQTVAAYDSMGHYVTADRLKAGFGIKVEQIRGFVVNLIAKVELFRSRRKK